MSSAWEKFDDYMREHELYLQTYALRDINTLIKARVTFMAAWSVYDLTASMILMGQRDNAIGYAKLTETLALEAIKRKHKPSGIGVRFSTDMARYSMYMALFDCRWLLDGKESVEILEKARRHIQKEVEEVIDKPRVKRKKMKLELYAETLSRLGEFELAKQYLPPHRKKGGIGWSDGCTDKICTLLLTKVVHYMADPDNLDVKREEIVGSYSELFRLLRSCAMSPIYPANWLLAINTAYHGLKNFEELRHGVQFTYENVVRSIRYELGKS